MWYTRSITVSPRATNAPSTSDALARRSDAITPAPVNSRGPARVDRGGRDCVGPAGERIAGAGGVGGARGDGDRPRVPHRPGLRGYRGEAGAGGGEDSAGGVGA